MTDHIDTMHDILDDHLFQAADRRLARVLLNMFGGKDAAVLSIETTPTRLAELIGNSRQNVHKSINRFRAIGVVTKKSKELYHLHIGPLQKFLASENTDRNDVNHDDTPSQ